MSPLSTADSIDHAARVALELESGEWDHGCWPTIERSVESHIGPGGGAFGPPLCLRDVVPRPLRFAIEGLMLDGDITAFVGEGDAGKSTLLYHCAAAIAGGHAALEHCRVHTPGPVLIISGGEDDASLMSNRITAMCTAHGWPVSDVLSRIHVYDDGMDLDSRACEARIIQALRDLGARAFFCDPLADLLGDSAEENSNRDARRITRVLRRITVATRTACGIVHHASKPSEGRGKAHRVRGASAWLNATRLTWWVEKSADGIVLEAVKANRLARPLPHRILRTVTTEEDGLMWRACHLSLDPTAVVSPDDTMTFLRLLRDAQTPPNSRMARALLADQGLGTDRANTAMRVARDRGWVTRTPGNNRSMRWALTDLGRDQLPLSGAV